MVQRSDVRFNINSCKHYRFRPDGSAIEQIAVGSLGYSFQVEAPTFADFGIAFCRKIAYVLVIYDSHASMDTWHRSPIFPPDNPPESRPFAEKSLRNRIESRARICGRLSIRFCIAAWTLACLVTWRLHYLKSRGLESLLSLSNFCCPLAGLRTLYNPVPSKFGEVHAKQTRLELRLINF